MVSGKTNAAPECASSPVMRSVKTAKGVFLLRRVSSGEEPSCLGSAAHCGPERHVSDQEDKTGPLPQWKELTPTAGALPVGLHPTKLPGCCCGAGRNSFWRSCAGKSSADVWVDVAEPRLVFL